MKKIITMFTFIFLFWASTAQAKNFSNYIENHENLQKRLSRIQSKITINENQLDHTDANLRSIKKDLKKINKRHKKIYKSLVKQFKISKSSLATVKNQQKSMKFKRNDDELQSNLINSYKLAEANNVYMQSIAQDSKSKAFTDSTNSGVYGLVSMITGNCMPIAGGGESTCNQSSFPTTVIIRQVTKSKDLEHYTHYSGNEEALLVVSTDDSGIFKTDLSPGEYSVFILDDLNKEYCNSYDGLGNACKIIVKDTMYSEFNAALDRAAY